MTESPVHVVPRASGAAAAGAGRRLRIQVLRHNPAAAGSAPRWQSYELEEAHGMTLFIALTEIRERLDPSLQFDFVCRAGICGSCAMVIDGRPGLACRTLTKNHGSTITLAPLPFFELIGDLSVNTGSGASVISAPKFFVSVRQAKPGRPLIIMPQLPQMPARQTKSNCSDGSWVSRISFSAMNSVMPWVSSSS